MIGNGGFFNRRFFLPFFAILYLKRATDLLHSRCKKTPTTALLSFLKQSFTICKLLGFKNFESLVFDAFLSKTGKSLVFLQALHRAC
jgi:hypothetical protein